MSIQIRNFIRSLNVRFVSISSRTVIDTTGISSSYQFLLYLQVQSPTFVTVNNQDYDLAQGLYLFALRSINDVLSVQAFEIRTGNIIGEEGPGDQSGLTPSQICRNKCVVEAIERDPNLVNLRNAVFELDTGDSNAVALAILALAPYYPAITAIGIFCNLQCLNT